MTFARQFAPLPDVPQSGIDYATAEFMRAVKQNVELLCGLRGVDTTHLAVCRGDIAQGVSEPAAGEYTGALVDMDGAGPYGFVPTATDYIALANEVTLLRNTLATLISIIGRTT